MAIVHCCLWSLIEVMRGKIEVVFDSFLQLWVDLALQFADWSPMTTTTTTVVPISATSLVLWLLLLMLLLLLGELLGLELVVEVFLLLLLLRR